MVSFKRGGGDSFISYLVMLIYKCNEGLMHTGMFLMQQLKEAYRRPE